MKTLIPTLILAATLAAPATAFAAQTVARPAPTDTATAAQQAPVQTQNDVANATRVAMIKKQAEESGYGKSASDDRAGLTRIQEQTRQLGATN